MTWALLANAVASVARSVRGPRRRAGSAGPAENDLHVWRLCLDTDATALGRLWDTLSADEQARTARFRKPSDRAHFTAARGMLRAILGAHLDQPPDRVQFSAGPYGKPALARSSSGLRFNLSHADGLALVAVARGREVGVDIERIQPDAPHERLAERFFAREEAAALRSFPVDARAEAFARCWVRKEAYVKARGEGLRLPLDRFTVSLAAGAPAALRGIGSEADEAARWSLMDLPAPAGYAAALAVEGRPGRRIVADWTPAGVMRSRNRVNAGSQERSL